MMNIKTFNHKGQMINYYRKMKENKKIDFVIAAFSAEIKAWTIWYEYKKN